MKKPELLAPAGDLLKLKTAFAYGADAVYVGGKQFSLRAQAGNFSLEELAAAVDYAHGLQKKLYVAVNVFAHNADIAALPAYLQAVAEIGPDALIVSDLGVFALAREHAPQLPLHISTQANNVNWKSAQVWRDLGASRIILGRELSLVEAQEICAQAGLETEFFVHGAMCMSYSGRCLLSNFLTGRDANRGDCAQSCRWQYALVEEKRPGEYLPLEEDARGSYIFNSRDLCLLAAVPQLLQAGLSAWKIEGRNKSAYYIANVVRIYRQALDAAFADPQGYALQEGWLQELAKISHREYTTGFAFGLPGPDSHRYADANPVRGYDFAALIESVGDCLVLEQRNHIAVGDELEILLPDGRNLCYAVAQMYDEAGMPLQAAPHPRQQLRLPLTAEQRAVLHGCPLPLVVRRPNR